MSYALSIRGLAKRFRCGIAPWGSTVEVLRHVDLDVGEGEFVGVIAPAGAGKSTLLLCAGGLLLPDAGTVTWFGAKRWPAGRPAGIAYVPQRCPYHRFLTVREALELYATLNELPGRDRSRRVWQALECVGLDAHGDDTIARLHEPLRRRLAVAQAVIGRPRLVLLDETFDALDAETTGELAAALEGMRREGCAMIHTSGERAAPGSADRMFTLAHGHLHRVAASADPRVLDLVDRRSRVAEADA